jgi:hypothetical protein
MTVATKRQGTATCSLPEAAAMLGIGHNVARQLIAAGEFPVPVLRLGRNYRVPTAPLKRLLGLPVEPVAADRAAAS